MLGVLFLLFKLIFKTFISPLLFMYKTGEASDLFHKIYGYEIAAYYFPSRDISFCQSGLVMLRINIFCVCNFLKLYSLDSLKR